MEDFTPEDIRQALAAYTYLCICQDCEANREESYKLLANWLNARLREVTQERTEG